MTYGHTQSYPKPRPDLTVEQVRGGGYANCYSRSHFLVTCLFRLDKGDIDALAGLGVLGCGQEYTIKSQCDGKEEPGLIAPSQLVEYDSQGAPVVGRGLSGRFTDYKYYTYTVIRYCDSSG